MIYFPDRNKTMNESLDYPLVKSELRNQFCTCRPSLCSVPEIRNLLLSVYSNQRKLAEVNKGPGLRGFHFFIWI